MTDPTLPPEADHGVTAVSASPPRTPLRGQASPVMSPLRPQQLVSEQSATTMDTEGDLLGVEELNPTSTHVNTTENRASDGSVSIDDDDTAPSSIGPTSTGPQTDSTLLGRLIQNTRKRLSSGPNEQDGADPVYNVEGDVPEEDDNIYDGQRPLIYGYLHKLGRNGKWQRRFFETDGESLSYFKSHKRVKLLATLDLFKVGTIAVSANDQSGCTFVIQVADRPYSLRAETKATCKDWVITLNRIREARMQVGGVKLVTPKFHPQPPDLLDQVTSPDEIAPRVVLVANRQRTRAVDSDNPQVWEHLVAETPEKTQLDPSKAWIAPAQSAQAVLGKWQKRHNALGKLSRRLMKWARSIRKLASCTLAHEHVQLDKHLHPPGHDDAVPAEPEPEKKMTVDKPGVKDSGSWEGSKEETKVEISHPVLDDLGETRELS